MFLIWLNFILSGVTRELIIVNLLNEQTQQQQEAKENNKKKKSQHNLQKYGQIEWNVTTQS